MAKCVTDRGNRVLFLVHRKELCDQIRETFFNWGVRMSLCDIMMVQTATRRIHKLKKPGLLITDESHHCLANSYRRIYEAFPGVPSIGVTATPIRLNGGGLGDVNDRLIEGVSTKWLIDNNYLAPYDYYAPSIADLTGLHSNRGEYIASEITERLNTQAIHGDVIAYYQKYASGKQAICYCASIEHSKAVSQAFHVAGIPAAHIDGDTSKNTRANIISQYRAGEIKILCNVDLISEGFDVPDCACAILLRPTKSLTLYIQQSMRCMRYQPGKRAIIIDHVGNYARFGLPDADRVWSLDPKPTGKKQDGPSVRQCPKCFAAFEPENTCPMCGYVFPKQERKIEEIRAAALEKIEGFVLHYDSPGQCKTYAELQAYGRRKNYKPGWSYVTAKRMGLIS